MKKELWVDVETLHEHLFPLRLGNVLFFFSSLTTISIFKLTTAETSHLPAHSCQFHHRRGHFVKKSVTNSLLLLL